MAEDLPGPPGSGSRDDRPGEPPTEPTEPTEPLGGAAQPPMPPPSSGQPGGSEQPPGYGSGAQEPQPYAQQYGYGQQPGYGYPPGPQTEGLATAALVIAIVGFFICPPVGAIVALVLANSAKQRIEASGGRLSGLEQARAARIIAIIELVLTAIVLLVGIIVGAIAITTSGGHDEQVEVPTTVSAPRSMNAGSSSSWTTVASSVGSLSTSA
jgi:hypothetical protein